MALVICPRDLSILSGMFEARVMSIRHLCELFFDGKLFAARKRIGALKKDGFLRERPREPHEPSLLFLTKKGVRLLNENGLLARYPEIPLSAMERRLRVSDLTLRHELEVLDVKVALTRALRNHNHFSLEEFSTWPELFQFTVTPSFGYKPMLIKPDGFIRIREGNEAEHTFFLEVDRSEESHNKFIPRLRCYPEFYRSGGFAVRCGGLTSIHSAA